MASYRMCGASAKYVHLSDEENSREGWIMHLAVCAPRETPSHGDRVQVEGTDYTVELWTEVSLDEAPPECRDGRQPNQGVFELRLQPV